ncbi:hypothetical protein MHY1_02757 [Methylovirgula sp. HY1]|nr:hypothetical protein MHY1_02757 [Methylovirgula sp. HY1]
MPLMVGPRLAGSAAALRANGFVMAAAQTEAPLERSGLFW